MQKETASGGTDSQRVRVTLEVAVEDVDYDPVSCRLRVRGKNILENPHVKLGSYHTIGESWSICAAMCVVDAEGCRTKPRACVCVCRQSWRRTGSSR